LAASPVVESENIHMFPKWTGVLARTLGERKRSPDCDPRPPTYCVPTDLSRPLKELAVGNMASSLDAMDRTNRVVNRHRYILDTVNWGVDDFWETEPVNRASRLDPVKCLDMLNQTTNQLKHAIQEARQVIYNLRPGQYDNLDLASALSNYLKSYEAQFNIRTQFTPFVEGFRLEPKTKVFLFRMVQEALSNVTKHAKATQVGVKKTMNNGTITTNVIDNGTGFDVQAESKNPEKWDHFGLGGMMERARMLSGEVRWESKKGEGTQVIIQVPLKNKEKATYGKKN